MWWKVIIIFIVLALVDYHGRLTGWLNFYNNEYLRYRNNIDDYLNRLKLQLKRDEQFIKSQNEYIEILEEVADEQQEHIEYQEEYIKSLEENSDKKS